MMTKGVEKDSDGSNIKFSYLNYSTEFSAMRQLPKPLNNNNNNQINSSRLK